MDEHGWTTYDEPDLFQGFNCCETTIENWSTWWNFQAVLNFKVFTRIFPKAHWDHKRVTNICKTMPHMPPFFLHMPNVPLGWKVKLHC